MLTLAGTAAYAALTGFGQPAQRALGMTAIYLVARLLSRDRDSLNALGAAALGMLVWSPSSLFEASFQMTALVIVAIGGIAIPLGERSFLRYARVARTVYVHPRRHGDARESELRLMLEMWGDGLAEVLGGWARTLPARGFRVVLWALELGLIAVVAELVMVLPMARVFSSRGGVCAAGEYGGDSGDRGAGAGGDCDVCGVADEPLGGGGAGCGDGGAAAWGGVDGACAGTSAGGGCAGAGAGAAGGAGGGGGLGGVLLAGAPVAGGDVGDGGGAAVDCGDGALAGAGDGACGGAGGDGDRRGAGG